MRYEPFSNAGVNTIGTSHGTEKHSDTLRERLQSGSTLTHVGRVVRAVGTSIRVSGLPVRIGQRCQIQCKATEQVLFADVVGIEQNDAILVPLNTLHGVSVDSEVRVTTDHASILVGSELLGRVLDGFGNPLDGKPAVTNGLDCPLSAAAPNPLSRTRITTRLQTGIKAIDGVLTVGKGQRTGIFAPAGAGKSTLLGMLANGSEADVIVVGLVGERGREVREFIEDALDDKTQQKAVLVAATSDRPAMERVRAAETATAIAEGFRDQGKNVLLLVDSVTRYARALREMGLAVGEPPVRHGFTPSVFAELPRLFERSGTNARGSISAFYTVLTDDDTGTDPIAEETKSILDGHIVLSRALAEAGQFPAVDVLLSQSRLFNQLVSSEHLKAATRVRQLLSKYQEIEFLIQVGEYVSGSDEIADEAIQQMPAIRSLLRQTTNDNVSFELVLAQLCQIAGLAESEQQDANSQVEQMEHPA